MHSKMLSCGLKSTCNAEDALTMTGVGLIIRAITGVVVITALGLSPLGLIAGRHFAGVQGAGIATGSVMAAAQSAAMTGAGVGVTSAVRAVTGAATACIQSLSAAS